VVIDGYLNFIVYSYLRVAMDPDEMNGGVNSSIEEEEEKQEGNSLEINEGGAIGENKATAALNLDDIDALKNGSKLFDVPRQKLKAQLNEADLDNYPRQGANRHGLRSARNNDQHRRKQTSNQTLNIYNINLNLQIQMAQHTSAEPKREAGNMPEDQKLDDMVMSEGFPSPDRFEDEEEVKEEGAQQVNETGSGGTSKFQ
jgi:hypothetical protein